MKKKLLVALLASLLITGCVKAPKLENGEEVVASVDGKQYTANDLYAELKKQYGPSSLVNMIDKFLVTQELENTDSEEAQAKSYVEQMKNYYESNGYNWESLLMSNGYTEETLTEEYTFGYAKETVAKNYYKSQITDSEIENYYNDEIIGDITAKQILITSDGNDDMSEEEKKEANAKAYNTALEVIEKLNNGGDFSELAKEYSKDASSAVGGTLAPFNKQSNYPTEFINAAIELEVDKYSTTPIQTTYGYHILYIVSKDEKQSLDDMKETIKSTLAEKQISENENYSEVAWKAIREKYNLDIYDTVVKEKYEQTMSQY